MHFTGHLIMRIMLDLRIKYRKLRTLTYISSVRILDDPDWDLELPSEEDWQSALPGDHIEDKGNMWDDEWVLEGPAHVSCAGASSTTSYDTTGVRGVPG